MEKLQKKREEYNSEVLGQHHIAPKRSPSLTLEGLKFIDGNKTIKVRTGLFEEEFSELLDLLRAEQEPIKRGPKLWDLDLRLVVILQWLQLGQTYEKLAFFFHTNASRIQTIITSIWEPLAKVVVENYIPKTPLEYRPTRRFVNYGDATLLPIVKPIDPGEIEIVILETVKAWC